MPGPRGGGLLWRVECVVSAPGWGAWSGGGIPACTEADRPCEQKSWHMLLKILPCPKLRGRLFMTGQDIFDCALQVFLNVVWPKKFSDMKKYKNNLPKTHFSSRFSKHLNKIRLTYFFTFFRFLSLFWTRSCWYCNFTVMQNLDDQTVN